MPTPDEFVLDPMVHYPEAAAARDALARGDWAACRAALDVLTPSARSGVLGLVAERPVEDLLRQVLTGDPADGAAGALLGRRLTRAAWDVRTDRRAEEVSAAQFAGMRDRLRQAEQVLLTSAAHRPDDPAVWAARITTAMGLELEKSEVRRRYDRVARLHPAVLNAQTAMLQALQPKWGGSWESLQSFCREAVRAAPPGSPSGLIAAELHLERLFTLDGGAQAHYLDRADVRAEVYAAAQLSVWHPAFGRDWGWVVAASTFAYLFWRFQDRPATASMFRVLGNFAHEYPWSRGSSGAQPALHTARAWALGGAR